MSSPEIYRATTLRSPLLFIAASYFLPGLDRFYSISSTAFIAFAGIAQMAAGAPRGLQSGRGRPLTRAATLVLAGDPFVALYFYGLE